MLNVISRSPSQLQPVLETIVNTAGRLFEAYDVAVFLRDEEALTVAAHQGTIQIINASWPITRDWVSGRAVADREPVHIADLQTLGQEFPDGQAMALRHGTRTVLSTPLLRDNVAVGAITLRRAEVRPFSAKQVALLQTFADQAVIAIENTRLFEEVQARTRELQEALEYQTATSEVLSVISRAPSQLEPVFEAIVQTATRLCQADGAIVCTRGEDELYHYSAVSGHSEEVGAVVHKRPIAADRGSVSGRAVLERRTVQIHDALADPEFTRFDTQAVGQFRTLLGVPLLREGTPIGVISMQRRRVEPFTEKQIDLVTTFADQAVIAIENARLFEEVQARTAELQESLEYQTATSEVLKVISRAPSHSSLCSTRRRNGRAALRGRICDCLPAKGGTHAISRRPTTPTRNI